LGDYQDFPVVAIFLAEFLSVRLLVSNAL